MTELETMVVDAAVADAGDAAITVGTANTNPKSIARALSARLGLGMW
ncbi:hypothetical protein [Herbidospora yilanensis]|nr:hypothetical protein [Herbidospora yilanensis]